MSYSFYNNWEIPRPPSPEYGPNYEKKLEKWVNNFKGDINTLLYRVDPELVNREKLKKVINKKKKKTIKKIPKDTITLEELLSQVKIK